MPPVAPVRLNHEDSEDLAHPILFEYLAPERIYALVINSPAFSSGPSAFKSTDGGSTWTAQDDFNSPGWNVGTWDVVQDGARLHLIGSFARVIFPFTIQTFDTVTDTWSAASPNGPAWQAAPPEGAVTIRLVQVASGDLWAIVYHPTSGAHGRIDYNVFSGGAWGGDVPIVSAAGGTQNYLMQAFIDSTNVLHVIYKTVTGAPVQPLLGPLFHRSVTVGGVVSAEDTIDASNQPWNTGRAVSWVNPVTGLESLVIPYLNPIGRAGVWMGTPVTAPIWTFTLVDTIPWPAGYTDYGLAENGRGGTYAFVAGVNLYLAWASHDPTYAVTNRLLVAKNDGHGWQAPALVYDEVANPPSWTGDFIEAPELYAESVTILNNGQIASAGNIDCVGAAFLPPASLPPPPPPTPPSPPTYWNPGSAVSLLCEKNYPWSVPPKDRIPVDVKNSIPAPAANVLTEIWSYTVPDGMWFVFDTLLFQANVAGFVPGSGSLIFTLDVNTPTTGTALPVGRPIAKFTTNVGDLAEPVQSAPVQLYQGDTLRAKVLITDNTLGVGLPNVIHAAVEGWLFPHSRNV